MTATTQTFWDDRWLRAAVKAAFRDAALKDKAVAQANARSAGSSGIAQKMFLSYRSDISAVMGSRDFKAHWFELGTADHWGGPRNYGRGADSFSAGSFVKLRSRRSRGATGKGKAVKFTKGDGGFTSAPFRVPGMNERPYLKPAAATFPAIYRASARARIPAA